MAKFEPRGLLNIMKRIFDLLLSILVILIMLSPMLLISLAIRLSSKGPILYWSDRVGKNNKIFKMPKFRSMLIGTPAIATHLLKKPDEYLSPIGSFLRRYSLDEIPQLFLVLQGEMSFVGPRPALFNQKDLVKLRTENGLEKLLPGITGWAQVNGRDELSIAKKVSLDKEYLIYKSFWFDIKILWMTFLKVIKTEGIKH